MPSFLVLILILPLVGAVGTFALALVPRLRSYAYYVALGAILPTTILVLILRWMGPKIDVPVLWRPSLLFGATPMLQNDAALQPLAFALALATSLTVLVALSRQDRLRPQILAVLLVLLPPSFVALWSANPLTIVAGWAIYDLVLAAGHIAASGWDRTAIRGLVFGGLATLLLWGGTLLSVGEGESSLWGLMTPSDAQLALWTAAGVLRLWIYPFHLAAPAGYDSSPSLVPFLMSPVLGWGLCLRLVSINGGSFPGGAWVLTLAALTLSLGGLLAWSSKSPRAMLPWISMEVTGAVLLAAVLAGDNASIVISSGCVAWTLGTMVLFSTDGLRLEAPWWNIPALIGALTLLGLPFTLGFSSQSALLGGIARGGHLWWGAAFFFGNIFLVASLARWLLAPSSSPRLSRYWQMAVYGAGLGVAALLLLISGLYRGLLVGGVTFPSLGTLFATPGLAGWLVWVISLALGGVLAWQEGNVRDRIEFLLDAVHDFLRLEWLYDVVVGAMDRGLGAIRAADEVVGGAGALLWSLLLFLLLLLIWTSR